MRVHVRRMVALVALSLWGGLLDEGESIALLVIRAALLVIAVYALIHTDEETGA